MAGIGGAAQNCSCPGPWESVWEVGIRWEFEPDNIIFRFTATAVPKKNKKTLWLAVRTHDVGVAGGLEHHGSNLEQLGIRHDRRAGIAAVRQEGRVREHGDTVEPRFCGGRKKGARARARVVLKLTYRGL